MQGYPSYMCMEESKKFSPKNKKDLGMVSHTPPLKKAKKQDTPSLCPIPFKNVD